MTRYSDHRKRYKESTTENLLDYKLCLEKFEWSLGQKQHSERRRSFVSVGTFTRPKECYYGNCTPLATARFHHPKEGDQFHFPFHVEKFYFRGLSGNTRESSIMFPYTNISRFPKSSSAKEIARQMITPNVSDRGEFAYDWNDPSIDISVRNNLPPTLLSMSPLKTISFDNIQPKTSTSSRPNLQIFLKPGKRDPTTQSREVFSREATLATGTNNVISCHHITKCKSEHPIDLLPGRRTWNSLESRRLDNVLQLFHDFKRQSNTPDGEAQNDSNENPERYEILLQTSLRGKDYNEPYRAITVKDRPIVSALEEPSITETAAMKFEPIYDQMMGTVLDNQVLGAVGNYSSPEIQTIREDVSQGRVLNEEFLSPQRDSGLSIRNVERKIAELKRQPSSQAEEKAMLAREKADSATEWRILRNAKQELSIDREQLDRDRKQLQRDKKELHVLLAKHKVKCSITHTVSITITSRNISEFKHSTKPRPPPPSLPPKLNEVERIAQRRKTKARFKIGGPPAPLSADADEVQNLRATLTDIKQTLDKERLEKRQTEERWKEERVRLLQLLPKQPGIENENISVESVAVASLRRTLDLTEEQVQLLAKENELLSLTIAKLHSDIERLQEELNLEKRGRQGGADAVIEEVHMAKRREKFLEDELKHAKSRLNHTIIELDQAKLDLMRHMTLTSLSGDFLANTDERSPTLLWSGESLWEPTGLDKDKISQISTELDQAPEVESAIEKRLRKELERLRRAIGEQEHEVIVLESEVKVLKKERDVLKIKHENLTAHTAHSKMMNRAFQELISAGDERSVTPSMVIRRRSSQGSLPSPPDTYILADSVPLAKKISQAAQILKSFESPSTETIDAVSGSPYEQNYYEEEAEKEIDIKELPLPPLVRSKERRTTGFIHSGAPKLSKKLAQPAALDAKKTKGFAQPVALNATKEGFLKGPKMIQQPKVAQPYIPTQVTLQEDDISQQRLIIPKRKPQRRGTGFVKDLQLSKLTEVTMIQEDEEEEGNGEKNDPKIVTKKPPSKVPGKKGMVKISKEEMMKKKLMVKKKPSGPPTASTSEEALVKPLRGISRELFPIYEEIEMRYLSTDTDTRAKLFQNLVHQLQESHTEMEQLIGEKEDLEKENEALKHHLVFKQTDTHEHSAKDLDMRIIALKAALQMTSKRLQSQTSRCQELELEVISLRAYRDKSEQIVITVRLETQRIFEYVSEAVDKKIELSLKDLLDDLQKLSLLVDQEKLNMKLIPENESDPSFMVGGPTQLSLESNTLKASGSKVIHLADLTKLINVKHKKHQKEEHSHDSEGPSRIATWDSLIHHFSRHSVDSALTETYDLKGTPSDSEPDESSRSPKVATKAIVDELISSSISTDALTSFVPLEPQNAKKSEPGALLLKTKFPSPIQNAEVFVKPSTESPVKIPGGEIDVKKEHIVLKQSDIVNNDPKDSAEDTEKPKMKLPPEELSRLAKKFGLDGSVVSPKVKGPPKKHLL